MSAVAAPVSEIPAPTRRHPHAHLMGRGSGQTSTASASLRSSSSDEISSVYGETEDGSEVTQLSAHAGVAAKARPTGGYGTDESGRADAKAVQAIARRLSAKNTSVSASDLTERAEDVYAGLCQRAASGQLNDAAFAQFAQLIDEQPDELRARLSA